VVQTKDFLATFYFYGDKQRPALASSEGVSRMFGSGILDLAVGLVFVYLVLSLAAPPPRRRSRRS
jgi:hypothetical protein